MIDVGKKFSDVAFQNPNRSRVIPRYFVGIVTEAIYGSMRAFGVPTRVRIKNKLGIEVWI